MLPETEFLHLQNSLHQLQVDLLTSADIGDERFQMLQANELKYRLLDNKAQYPITHGMMTGNRSFEVTIAFPMSSKILTQISRN